MPVLVVRGDAREDALDVLRRPIVFSGESANRPEAEEAAGRLAEAVGGHVVEQAAACAADLAAAHQASVVVVSAVGRHGAWLAHPAEQWLRSCPLPMLFVPAALGR